VFLAVKLQTEHLKSLHPVEISVRTIFMIRHFNLLIFGLSELDFSGGKDTWSLRLVLDFCYNENYPSKLEYACIFFFY